MVDRVTHRMALLGALLIAATALMVGPANAARAAPKPTPMSVTITGDGIPKPLTVQDADPALFSALMDQVSWLGGAGQGGAPASADLGSRYTVVVLSGGVAKQTFELYPLAKGGPRAFRPSNQPDRRHTTAAWFYGRLNMGETLRAAGVPLPDQTEMITGGIGGGERATDDDDSLDTAENFHHAMGDLRRVLLLNAGVLVAITLGLAGIALVVRRRTR